MKQRILNHFIEAKLNIVNILALHTYIDFCFDNNVGESIKGTTSHHHILPAAKSLPFTQYSNLKDNVWNGTHLLYKDHYTAHKLLADAINHISIVYSFTAMNNKDLANGRISEEDLISPDLYQEFMIRRSDLYREWCNIEITLNDESLSTNAKEVSKRGYATKSNKIYHGKTYKEYSSSLMSGENNIIHLKGVLEKVLNTKSTRYVNGDNMHTVGALRAAETMKKEIIIDGLSTSIYKENSKKLSITLNSKCTFRGKEITLAQKRGLERSEIMIKLGKMYRLKSVFDDSFSMLLYAAELRLISPGLSTKTKTKYLGKDINTIDVLYKRGRGNLIGLYCEEEYFDCDSQYDKKIIKNLPYFKNQTKYIIRSIKDNSINLCLSSSEAHKISQKILHTSINKPLTKRVKNYEGYYLHEIL